jgi:phosphoglycolate phosphatase-like HAD superfamily hydrolase
MRGVILDVDGTLVDSNDAHARSWVDVAAERGVTVTVERVRSLIGMGSDKLVPGIFGLRGDDPEVERIASRRAEIFRIAYLPHLKATRGAKALVDKLVEEGLAIAIASSARADELEALLKIARVSGFAEHATSSDDVERSKPDPDVVRAALARVGTPPAHTIMIGDTPYDIEAASKVGVGTIALRSGGYSDDDLSGALALYDDPAELVASWDESPLGSGRPATTPVPRRTMTTRRRRGAGAR